MLYLHINFIYLLFYGLYKEILKVMPRGASKKPRLDITQMCVEHQIKRCSVVLQPLDIPIKYLQHLLVNRSTDTKVPSLDFKNKCESSRLQKSLKSPSPKRRPRSKKRFKVSAKQKNQFNNLGSCPESVLNASGVIMPTSDKFLINLDKIDQKNPVDSQSLPEQLLIKEAKADAVFSNASVLFKEDNIQSCLSSRSRKSFPLPSFPKDSLFKRKEQGQFSDLSHENILNCDDSCDTTDWNKKDSPSNTLRIEEACSNVLSFDGNMQNERSFKYSSKKDCDAERNNMDLVLDCATENFQFTEDEGFNTGSLSECQHPSENAFTDFQTSDVNLSSDERSDSSVCELSNSVCDDSYFADDSSLDNSELHDSFNAVLLNREEPSCSTATASISSEKFMCRTNFKMHFGKQYLYQLAVDAYREELELGNERVDIRALYNKCIKSPYAALSYTEFEKIMTEYINHVSKLIDIKYCRLEERARKTKSSIVTLLEGDYVLVPQHVSKEANMAVQSKCSVLLDRDCVSTEVIQKGLSSSCVSSNSKLSYHQESTGIHSVTNQTNESEQEKNEWSDLFDTDSSASFMIHISEQDSSGGTVSSACSSSDSGASMEEVNQCLNDSNTGTDHSINKPYKSDQSDSDSSNEIHLSVDLNSRVDNKINLSDVMDQSSNNSDEKDDRSINNSNDEIDQSVNDLKVLSGQSQTNSDDNISEPINDQLIRTDQSGSKSEDGVNKLVINSDSFSDSSENKLRDTIDESVNHDNSLNNFTNEIDLHLKNSDGLINQSKDFELINQSSNLDVSQSFSHFNSKIYLPVNISDTKSKPLKVSVIINKSLNDQSKDSVGKTSRSNSSPEHLNDNRKLKETEVPSSFYIKHQPKQLIKDLGSISQATRPSPSFEVSEDMQNYLTNRVVNIPHELDTANFTIQCQPGISKDSVFLYENQQSVTDFNMSESGKQTSPNPSNIALTLNASKVAPVAEFYEVVEDAGSLVSFGEQKSIEDVAKLVYQVKDHSSVSSVIIPQDLEHSTTNELLSSTNEKNNTFVYKGNKVKNWDFHDCSQLTNKYTQAEQKLSAESSVPAKEQEGDSDKRLKES